VVLFCGEHGVSVTEMIKYSSMGAPCFYVELGSCQERVIYPMTRCSPKEWVAELKCCDFPDEICYSEFDNPVIDVGVHSL
jgi:hypothetical protein